MTSPNGHGSRTLVFAVTLVALALCVWALVSRSTGPTGPTLPATIGERAAAPESTAPKHVRVAPSSKTEDAATAATGDNASDKPSDNTSDAPASSSLAAGPTPSPGGTGSPSVGMGSVPVRGVEGVLGKSSSRADSAKPGDTSEAARTSTPSAAGSPHARTSPTEEGERTVTGHVTDPEGKPLGGVEIGASGLSSRRTTSTDAEGFYRLVLPKYWYSLVAFSLKGYEIETVEPRFNGTQNAVLDQVLKPLGTIFGRVLGPQGQPLQSTVELAVFMKEGSAMAGDGTGASGASNAGGESGGDSMAYPIGPAATTALAVGGGFEIQPRKLVAGDYYSVRANNSAFGSGQSVWVRADESRRIGPLEIRLSWRGLKGHVVDAETGQPVPGAIVTLHLLSNQMNPDDWNAAAQQFKEPTVFTDPQGGYELAPVPAGDGNVFVYHADYGIQRFAYTMDAKGSDSVAKDLPMALRVNWKGRLLYHDGTPVTHWMLIARQMVDPVVGLAVFGDRTKDSNGVFNSFQLAPLAPGSIKFNLILPPQGGTGISTDYDWTDEIPKVRERKDDLVLPALVPVQITIPAGMVRRYQTVPATKDSLSVTISVIRYRQLPAAMTRTILLPPGHCTIRASSNPANIASPGVTPTPAPPTEIEVDIPETGPFQIQLP